MQRRIICESGVSGDGRVCSRCKQVKSVLEFAPYKEKIDTFKNICTECELAKREQQHLRAAAYRTVWEQRRRKIEGGERTWERKLALRQEYEQGLGALEQWYRQQPDRCCKGCGQVLPASAFGGTASVDGFVLHIRCLVCHKALQEQRRLDCCLCQRKTARQNFISQYDGYALCCSGAWISLCCLECEPTFRILSEDQKKSYIQACCQQSFSAGQYIYAEIDPETNEIRYIGRTNRPKRRHTQHLSDVSPIAGMWGSERKRWYTRRNWMHALSQKGLTPTMRILRQVEVSPLVLEWEQRYIWHGIQQGWKLLNVEAVDEAFVQRVRATSLDFLEVSFEKLVQAGFFTPNELVTFLAKWH